MGYDMTWYVKARKSDGTVASILCDDPRMVASNLIDRRKMGRKAWIEDTQGRPIADADFTGGEA